MPIHMQILLKQSTALMCSLLLLSGAASSGAQAQEPQQAAAAAADEQAPKISNDELDSLVAPIALYQDPLLAQVLAASTYPLEIVQLQQFLLKHKELKDKALADAVMKQKWDPSIQSMAALPDVVKRLADDIGWTTDLGNAVLAQESDVMDAVQRMRAKAQEKGNLKSSEQLKVETKVVESKSVIVIEQSKPDVVYVPSYDPVVVYGAPAYPYPPIAYPPPGYYAAGAAISFGVGMAIGAAWGGGGGWCCNSGWGGNNNININNNNTFVNNSNKQINNSGNRSGNNSGNRSGNNNWQHNAQHRGGAPYSNKATANKFGGTARGDSTANRQASGRQNQAGSMDRGGGRSQAGGMDRGGGGAGGDRVGSRDVSSGSGGSSKGGGFGGGSGGSRGSASSAKASSSRGSSSMGGGSRGGSRGGGGGRRR